MSTRSPKNADRARLTCLLLLFLLPSLTRAERLPLKVYTVADGLAHNAVNKIVRDSRGFLWFCTEEGLSRFDGYTFTNFTTDHGLPNSTVNDFLETRSGEIWLGTNAGLVRFDPKGVPAGRVVHANEGVTPAPMFTVIVPEDEDRNARVVTKLLEGRDGTIWCGTMKHLYHLERQGGRFELLPVDIELSEYPKQIYVLDLLEDRGGSLWVASFSGLFRRRPDGSSAQYTKRDGLPDNNIHDLLEDHQGRLWAGTRLGGFFRFLADDTRDTTFVAQKYGPREGLPTSWIFQLYEASDHRFWVATNTGLVEFFPDGDQRRQRFRAYTRRNGLSHQEITALGEDTGGNLWLGTNAAGAMKMAHSGFVTYGEQDGIASVNAVFEAAAGGVCFRGSVLGDQRASAFDGAKLDLLRAGADTFFPRFGRFDGQSFGWFKPDIPFDFGWVFEQVAVQTHHGEWWLGSGAGLYRFPASDNFARIKTARPLAIYTMKDGLAADQVWRLFADSGDNIWVSAFGLARWDRASRTLSNLASAPGLPSLKDNLPRSFGEDRAGNIWIGFNTGVARYRDGGFTFFNASDTLPPGGINYIYSDHAGRLWLASSRGGLIRVDDPAVERPAFVTYTTAQGLSSNSTEVITEDLYGNIYVATGRGLDQLDPATGRTKHFTSADGLAPGNIIAAFRDRGGALWFGTHRGLSRFIPAPARSVPPPPILITGLNVAGEQRTVSALGESKIGLKDLEPDRNQLQIDFVALGFVSGEVLRYQYKLEGSDPDWSALAQRRTVNYASLAPGRYRFLVRAANSDGIASVSPAVVTFTVLRPVWQRWWFLALTAALFISAAFALYRYRVARILELANVRTRIATDLHDDIGANLTQIAILSEVVKQQLGNGKGEKDDPLSSIARISRESVAAMSDIVWAVNPRRDSLRDLVRRMRRHAEEVFVTRDVTLDFAAPEPNLKLGVDVRRDLFLIFKEAVNNAARHSLCSHVAIALAVAGQSLELEINDNGVGFDSKAESDGQGLSNMRERARKLGGELELTSPQSGGTRIRVRVPHARAARPSPSTSLR